VLDQQIKAGLDQAVAGSRQAAEAAKTPDAQISLVQAQQGLLSADSQLIDLTNQMNQLIALPPETVLELEQPAAPSKPFSVVDQAVSAAVATSPKIQEARTQVDKAEAALWVTVVLMSGFFERHPKINAAVFEASSTWLSFLIDECDKAYRLYKNERQLPPLKRLPSETFFEHCMTGFEGDEAPPARLPEFYGDILCWSSDVYHHDGDDVWRAIETMQKYDLPKEDQAKFLGANARRLYKVQAPARIIRDRVTEIERPDWWPTDEEVRAALRPEAAVRRMAAE